MSDDAKRPYERPVLVQSSVFGAEALSTGCCRASGVCSLTSRSGGRLLDPLKITTSSNS